MGDPLSLSTSDDRRIRTFRLEPVSCTLLPIHTTSLPLSLSPFSLTHTHTNMYTHTAPTYRSFTYTQSPQMQATHHHHVLTASIGDASLAGWRPGPTRTAHVAGPQSFQTMRFGQLYYGSESNDIEDNSSNRRRDA